MSQRIDIFEEVKRLKQDLEYERDKRKKLEEICSKLEKENKELKKLPAQFLNSNTPSSQLPFSFKPFSNREAKGTNPRGKPVGSNGATGEEPEKIDEKIDVRAKQCPNADGEAKAQKTLPI